MTFTYDLTAPTDLTRVRFLIQDTDPANPRFQDEDLQFMLDENNGNVDQAVITVLKSEQVRLATLPNYQVDWLKVERQYQREQMKQLIDEKEAEAEAGDSASAGTGAIFLTRPK